VYDGRVVLADSDLTALARIRNAALESFSRDGVAATSIRDVASRAGVSPGLVQYYFPSKAALVAAVNDYVLEIATNAFRDLPGDGSPTDVQQQLGDRVTAAVREHPTALLYVARGAADGEQAALEMFDAFVAIVAAHWRGLAEQGLLRPDADITWTTIEGVVLVLGSVLFNAAIERHLPAPLFAPEQLEQWNAANNALFREGAYKVTPAPGADGAR
jgi:AcrR family transcriptional regulator